jgi:putative ABC transport system permease protein
MFLLEGLGTGLLGSALGLGLGVVFFTMVARTTEGLFRGAFGGLTEQVYQFQMSPMLVALAFSMGVGISVLASWLPAREAAAAPPVEAFRPMYFQRGVESWRPRTLLLAALLGCGAWLGSLSRSSAPLFYASMVMLFLAAVAVIPSFVLALVRPLRPLADRLLAVEGALAVDSLARAPRRTVTTLAVLVLVFAQTVMIAGINRSTRRTLEAWIEGAFHCDLVLGASANFASRTFRFPAGFDQLLRAVPGVRAVEPLRAVHVPFRGQPVLIVAADYALEAGKKAQRVIAGDWREMCLQTAAGDGIFISETLALREHLRPGSRVELDAPAGTLRLPVRGIVNDHSDKRGVIFLALRLYRSYWNDATLDKFRIDVAPGQPVEAVRARLREAVGDRYPASILTREEMREYVFHPRGRRLSPLDMQLLISVIVGALALMNMASISVAERSREFALLRSVGGFRRQVRRSLLVELLTTGGIALMLGLALGGLLLVYLLAAVERYVTGVRLEYVFPWNAAGWLGGVAVLAALVGVLAVQPALARVPLSVALDAE